MSPRTVADFLGFCTQRTERLLTGDLRTRRNDAHLTDAIRYACLSPGKRIRPALVYATAQTLGLAFESVDHIAHAVELLHSYSLIHDDLPAVDNDDFRRGQPTCHKRFGEATAILAGDAMQAMAYEVLAKNTENTPGQTLTQIALLAEYTGTEGMSGGQALDIAPRTRMPERKEVEQIHRLKTGMLIAAAIRMTLICSPDTDDKIRTALNDYAQLIGLVFQIKDDLLDENKDQLAATPYPPTYPAVLGVDATRRVLTQLHGKCAEYLDAIGNRADTLRHLTDYIATRDE